MSTLQCRFCSAPLHDIFVDLGVSPVANAMIPANKPASPETVYPLCVYVCRKCLLVQLPNTVSRDDIFNNAYTYFSSYSSSWLAHAKMYVSIVIDRFKLDKRSFVVELASNDGYLLQYFVQENIPCLGVDPSANVAEAAVEKGVETEVAFFGEETAKRLFAARKKADLIIANNVLAHVPDINDFVQGIATLLSENGTATAEFPHIFNLIKENQFDTIYHEHYSYYSLRSISQIFENHNLIIYDVEELPTHGGSLRIYARHKTAKVEVSEHVKALRAKEQKAGLHGIAPYIAYSSKVAKTKRDFLMFCIQAKNEGKTIVGYGAAAKGNTFLNYCGVGTDILDYVVDKSPHKQNHLLPGTRIPVHAPEKIRETKPDYLLILPWNLQKEIAHEHSYIVEWGGKFVTAIPEVCISQA